MQIEIPEWARARRVIVLLGRECYIVKEPNELPQIKTVRCNRCGKCCQDPPEGWVYGEQQIDGITYCGAAREEDGVWHCNAGFDAPFTCCRDLLRQKPHPDCVIEYHPMTDGYS